MMDHAHGIPAIDLVKCGITKHRTGDITIKFPMDRQWEVRIPEISNKTKIVRTWITGINLSRIPVERISRHTPTRKKRDD